MFFEGTLCKRFSKILHFTKQNFRYTKIQFLFIFYLYPHGAACAFYLQNDSSSSTERYWKSMVCEVKASEKLLCCFAEGAKHGCVAVLDILLRCTQKYIFATHRHNCSQNAFWQPWLHFAMQNVTIVRSTHAYTKNCAFATLYFLKKRFTNLLFSILQSVKKEILAKLYYIL